MANMDQKIELKENGEENDIRKIQRKQDDKPPKNRKIIDRNSDCITLSLYSE